MPNFNSQNSKKTLKRYQNQFKKEMIVFGRVPSGLTYLCKCPEHFTAAQKNTKYDPKTVEILNLD